MKEDNYPYSSYYQNDAHYSSSERVQPPQVSPHMQKRSRSRSKSPRKSSNRKGVPYSSANIHYHAAYNHDQYGYYNSSHDQNPASSSSYSKPHYSSKDEYHEMKEHHSYRSEDPLIGNNNEISRNRSSFSKYDSRGGRNYTKTHQDQQNGSYMPPNPHNHKPIQPPPQNKARHQNSSFHPPPPPPSYALENKIEGNISAYKSNNQNLAHISNYSDLTNDDGAFQTVARYILEQLDQAESREAPPSSDRFHNYSLEIDPSLRHKFIDAVQIRMKHLSRLNLPRTQENYVQKLTRFCYDVGLGCDEPSENPLLRDRRMMEMVGDMQSNASHKEREKEKARGSINTVPAKETIQQQIPNQQHMSKINKMELIASQSKARHQIMIEIRESQTLYNESNTDKGKEYWKNYIDSLVAKLQEVDTALSIATEDGANTTTKDKFLDTTGNQVKAANEVAVATPIRRDYQNTTSSKTTKPYTNVTTAISPKSGITLPNYNSPDKIGNITSMAPISPLTNPPSNAFPSNYMQYSDTMDEQGIVLSAIKKNKKKLGLGVGGNIGELASTKDDIIKVISPADLPGSYQFEVFLNGKRFLVMTPDEGVKKGQMFFSQYEEMEEQILVSIPYRKWRDGLCDCFANGLCHISIWNSLCFPQITMGQIMTRLGLNWIGHKISSSKKNGRYQSTQVRNNAFGTTFILYSTWLLINVLTLYSIHINFILAGVNYVPPLLPSIILSVNNIFFFLYTVYIVASTRSYIRKKFHIRAKGSMEEDCGDCFYSTFFLCCTIAQMNRMTADFGLYRAVCCSDTGLPEHISVDVTSSSASSSKAGTTTTLERVGATVVDMNNMSAHQSEKHVEELYVV